MHVHTILPHRTTYSRQGLNNNFKISSRRIESRGAQQLPSQFLIKNGTTSFTAISKVTVKICLESYDIKEVVDHTWPKQKQGTTAAPACIAIFTKPNLFLRYTTCKLQEAQ
jgi:hypothetical protein